MMDEVQQHPLLQLHRTGWGRKTGGSGASRGFPEEAPWSGESARRIPGTGLCSCPVPGMNPLRRLLDKWQGLLEPQYPCKGKGHNGSRREAL